MSDSKSGDWTSPKEEKGMDRLIQLISKLQEVFSTVEGASNSVQLPQIVVVGDQSAGKSSLLERIVRKDFLPRGTGIVTRQPLVLHLVHTPVGDSRRHPDAPEEGDYARFKGGDKTFTDFDEVRKQIERLTRKTCGEEDVSNEEIHLEIFSSNVVDLCLVDLPGLISVVGEGQSADMSERISQMVEGFIKNKNAIILAVSGANVDLATSKSLGFAKKFDPKGDRTIGVLTKLDRLDKGVSVEDVLTSRKIKVKLGMIGVLNRSQEDLNNKKPLSVIEKEEVEFFKKNCSDLAEYHGTNFLAQRLNVILIQHIQKCLPSLTARIHDKMNETHDRLMELGESYTNSMDAILKTVNDFTKFFNQLSFDGGAVMDSDKMTPAAKISYIFHDEFPASIDCLNPLQGVKKEEMNGLLRNAMGLSPHLFIPPSAFTQLLKKPILKLIEPSLAVVDKTRDELIDTVKKANVSRMYDRFPKLKKCLQYIVKDELEQKVVETKKIITNSIQAEAAFINTRHPTFKAYFRKLSQEALEMKHSPNANGKVHGKKIDSHGSTDESFSDKEDDETDGEEEDGGEYENDKRNVKLIRKLVPAYFNAVKGNIKAEVPKMIVYNMVQHLHDNLSTLLTTKLQDNVEELFKEDPNIVMERTECLKLLEALKKAEMCIRDIDQVY